MNVIRLTASISVKMPSLPVNFNADLMAWYSQDKVAFKIQSTFSPRNNIVAASLLATPEFDLFLRNKCGNCAVKISR